MFSTRNCDLFHRGRPPGEPVLGIGIAGMCERVKELKGEFLISSSIGTSSIGIGTTIQVVLPLTRKEGTK